MPLQATSGAASYDAFGGGVAAVPKYIEDYFSTFLYTGTGAQLDIVNGIDLSTKGGMVWLKPRTTTTYQDNMVYDTNRGVNNWMMTNTTGQAFTVGTNLQAFNTNGFQLGSSVRQNASGVSNVSWSFAKSPKFFDVVTYTGNGTTQNIAHNLGSVPGCIIVKEASAAGNDWQVYHRSTTNTCGRLFLNLTNAENANGRANTWGDNTNPVPPTSTVFTVGNTGSVNNNGATFVAYLFAHNAGGFGLTGTDNVISCGSFTASAGQTTVTLGYEPQWILIKESSASGDNWKIWDTMRGWSQTTYSELYPNTSAAQAAGSGTYTYPTAAGFVSEAGWLTSGRTYIYIAIRRGPMKVPTSGTSVFSPQVQTPTGSTSYVMAGSSGFPIDWLPTKQKDTVVDWYQTSRLTNNYMSPNTTAAEGAYTYGFDLMQGVSAQWNTNPTVSYAFRRAPSFFDVVCYTGTGTAGQTYTHNLGVAPELMIIKSRSNITQWTVYQTSMGVDYAALLNSNIAKSGPDVNWWNNTAPTASVFSVGTYINNNSSGSTYVAYLFATCAGVSKVGSYTGTGATLQVDCGFTGGARFVLIKRTDSTGSWYVWDVARGISSGNDPYLLLNSTAAEVTNTDYIDAYSAGFEISSTAPAEINASGGSFIFLAIS